MSAICDVDLATFCGRIGNLYGRHGLCPPFALHAAAQGWMAREIPLSHCVDVIEQFLSRHAGSCYSGSGDWNFAWLNSLIQTSWHERSFATPLRPVPKQSRHDNWSDNYGSEEPNQRSRRGADLTAAPKLDPKQDSFEPDRIAVRQKAAGAISPVGGTRSVLPQKIHPKRSASKSSDPMPAQGPKKIEIGSPCCALSSPAANDQPPRSKPMHFAPASPREPMIEHANASASPPGASASVAGPNT
jgi:hypothetical protein